MREWSDSLCDRGFCNCCGRWFDFERLHFNSGHKRLRAPGQGVSTMPVEMRPAMPATRPHAAVASGRPLRWLAAAVTVLAATVAVLGAAMTAVILGIT
jgi:hypothetical protein